MKLSQKGLGMPYGSYWSKSGMTRVLTLALPYGPM
jgi:hypothetical protein